MMAEKIIEMNKVIMKEKPFANWIERGYQKDNCNYCVYRVTNCFVACHQCTLAVYCNDDYREKAWQFECPILTIGSSIYYRTAHLNIKN